MKKDEREIIELFDKITSNMDKLLIMLKKGVESNIIEDVIVEDVTDP